MPERTRPTPAQRYPAATIAAVYRAAAPLLPEDSRPYRLRIFGTDVLLFARLDEAEHARRLDAGARRLWIGHLDVLMNLPEGEPVPLTSIKLPLRKAVRALPHGAVRIEAGYVTRLAVRPLKADLAVVRGRSTARAGRFGAICPRMLLLDRTPADLEDLLFTADCWGVGVFAPAGDGLQVALPPAPFRPGRHTPAAWSLVEDLYLALLDQHLIDRVVPVRAGTAVIARKDER